MFLILINIETSFLLNMLWITKQFEIRRFSQYFFFFHFSKRRDKISSYAFLKILIFHLFYFPSYWNIVN